MDRVIATGPILAGECNRCGLCCQNWIGGTPYTCDHLEVTRAIGHPFATRCTVYATREHHMPITMTAEDGSQISAHCAANGTPEESRAIIQKGLGRGCSLTLL